MNSQAPTPPHAAGQGLPPSNTFPGSGANPFRSSSHPSTPTPAAQRTPENFFATTDSGTQTNPGAATPRQRRPSVNFSSTVEVRAPDGTATHINAQYPPSSSSDPAPAQAQTGFQGPPNGPPANPPPTPAAAAPEPGQPQPQQSAIPLPTPIHPFGGPFGGPIGAPPPAGTMNMGPPIYVAPGQQPYLWFNPPVVSSAAPAGYPGAAPSGYRSSQSSPYWPNQSYWLTNPPPPPPQPQQQAYMCVAQQPPTYAYAPAYAVNWNGMMYYM